MTPLLRFLLLFFLAFSAVPAAAQEGGTNRRVFQEAYLKTPYPQVIENLGHAVAISGNTAVVAAPGGNAIHAFQKRAGTWRHVARLMATETGSSNHFGFCVAISGDIIVVGATHDDSSATGVNGNESDHSAPLSGAAYIFERDAGGWRRTAYLKASNATAGDQFGKSVAVSGNLVMVGAGPGLPQGTQTGTAYVFAKTASGWSEEAYLKPGDTEVRGFGFSVAISGNTAIVGAVDFPYFSAPGSAFVFRRGHGGWQQEARLNVSEAGREDAFGYSVGASGDTVVVGMPYPVKGTGAVFVFVRKRGGWHRQAPLKSSNLGAIPFGESVAISGDTVVVGARYDSTTANGIDGNQTNNSAHPSGASYVFERRNDRWSQLAYLKASNPEGSDEFGCSVGISGGNIVVGALREGRLNYFDQIAPGTAYMFRVLPPQAELEVVQSPGPFPPTHVGIRSQEQALVLRNSGTETIRTLLFRQVGVARKDFHVRGRVVRNLEPAKSTRVRVSFRPSRIGLRRVTMVVVGDFPTKRVVLSGKGLPLAPRSPRQAAGTP